jgi:hypothetical protein
MKPVVFQFKDPFPFDAYSWVTSTDTNIDGIATARGTVTYNNDPVQWKLEGSTNGTFWTMIHDQATDYTSAANTTDRAACTLKRSSEQGPFPISNPMTQFRAPSSKCYVSPPPTYGLLEAGLTCTSPSVWAAVKAAYNSAFGTGSTSMQTPSASTTSAIKSDFKYSFDAQTNTCNYQFYETSTATSPARTGGQLRYASAAIDRITSRGSTLPTGTKITARKLTSAPPTIPNVPMQF